MIICLTGPMCSGKTTLAMEFEKQGYERIITYTTRPKREGEIEDVHYHFIGRFEFFQKKHDGYFAEFQHYNASFGECYYASARKDYVGNKVIVLDPTGIYQIKYTQPDIDLRVVFLDIPENILAIRAAVRGDDSNEVIRRMERDKRKFDIFRMQGIHKLRITDDIPAERYPELVAKISQKLQTV